MRRAGRVLAIAVAILLVLLLVALLLAPAFIERTIRAELARRGVDDIAMDISVPGLTESTVRNLRIGRDAAATADEIVVDYRIPELIHGHIVGIRLVHPRLHLQISQNGKLSFGSLDGLLQGNNGGGGGISVPAPVEIIDGSISAGTPAGEIKVQLDGTVSIEPGAGPLKLNISGPWLSAELAISLSLNGSVPALSGRVIQARVTHPLISIGSLTGEFTSSVGTEAPSATADFKLGDVSSPWLSVGSGQTGGNLSAQYKQGTLTSTLRLTGSDGSLESSVGGDPAQLLHLILDGHGLTIPEKLTGASFDATLDIDPGAWRAQLTEPANMEARLAPALRAALPDSLRSAIAEAPLILTVEPGLSMSRTDGGATIAGRIGLKQQSKLAASLIGSLEGNHGRLAGSADLRLDLPKLVLSGVTLDSPSLSAPLQIAGAEDEIQFRLRGLATLSAKMATIGTTRIAKLVIPFQPAEQPLLTLAPAGPGFALSAGAAKASGQFGKDQESFAVEWKGATLAAAPGSALQAGLTGARLELTGEGWQANGIEVRLNPDAKTAGPLEARFSIAELGQTGTRPLLAPLSMKGTVRPSETPVRFEVSGQGAGARVHFAIKGSHDLAQNKGSAVLTLEPLHFEQSGLQPGSLAPALGDVLTEATGTLTIGGTVSGRPRAS